MYIHEDLDTLYRKLDYALWQKESMKNSQNSTYNEAVRMISYYQRKIQLLSKKRNVIKQLTLF